MEIQFLPRPYGQSNRSPKAGLIAIIAGMFFLPFTPLHSKSTCKPEIRHSIYYKHSAYIKGFDDGYDGMDFENPFTFFDDQLLYEMGFHDGDEAYLDNATRHKKRKSHY